MKKSRNVYKGLNDSVSTQLIHFTIKLKKDKKDLKNHNKNTKTAHLPQCLQKIKRRERHAWQDLGLLAAAAKVARENRKRKKQVHLSLL